MKSYLAHHSLDNTAMKLWSKTAIYFQEESISYGSLYLSSNQLANCLRKNGIKRGDRVSYILPKSINSIKSILAILKADAIYVPIEQNSPLIRAKEILEDCLPSAIICDNSTLKRVKSLLEIIAYQPKIFVIDSNEDNHNSRDGTIWQGDISCEKDNEPSYLNIDIDIAYILYTSGSTGKPKGVMISHQNISSYINWAVDYFKINYQDNILNTSHLHFDMSTFDIYCALQTGASITLVPGKTLLFPIRLMEIIEKRKITIWKAVASLLSYFVKVEALRPHRMEHLQQVIFSGAPLPTKHLIEWMGTYPNKRFYNAYGPTECTGISTIYEVQTTPLDVNSPVPIGKACANKEVFALREDGTLAQFGELAELCIRASSLSCGCWNDKNKTEMVLTRNPLNNDYEERIYHTGDLVKKLPDGNYVFVGRKDHQIKYRGYRIELGEIEYALQAIDFVNDAAVISVGDKREEDLKIIAFIELDEVADLDGIQQCLKEKIPEYMLPHKLRVVRNLPRNENGKADKESLKKHYLISLKEPSC